MRYVTSNLSNRIPFETQLVMWNLFDRMKTEKDYLQIFQLRSQGRVQEIKHFQEDPPWSEEITFITYEPVNEKVYIIVEGNNEIMLLAGDY